MTRTRCSKCGKFAPKQLYVGGTDPALGTDLTINIFAIHVCGQVRNKKGRFIRRTSVEQMRPYQTYYNILMNKPNHGQTQPKM